MLYPELYKLLEKARWNMASDVAWESFEADRLTDDQARTIKMNAITEWAALPATEMFLRDNVDDSDFSAFMSVWFYEEQKHALVLMEYLSRFRPDLMPTEEELHAVRFQFDPAPPMETLMLHFCGEIRLVRWYRRAAEWHTEPVIRSIYRLLAEDEGRHSACYLKYMQRAMDGTNGDTARQAFVRIGRLMASERGSRPMHPTNLHVNRELYPRDTVQSRLPDPEWLTHWLDEQIRFDRECEAEVSNVILRSLSKLMGEEFTSSKDLARYLSRLRKGESAPALDGA